MATTISPPCKSPVNSTPSAEPPELKPQEQPLSEQPKFWSLKPWWCKPWSIISTGALMVGGSWTLLHCLWISLPLALVVLVWWSLLDGPFTQYRHPGQLHRSAGTTIVLRRPHVRRHHPRQPSVPRTLRTLRRDVHPDAWGSLEQPRSLSKERLCIAVPLL